MEKNQYELCIEVLRRFDKAGVLRNIVLIGSWCMPFYKEYFANMKYISSIKTRDIDFLIPNPAKIKTKIDIAELLKDLGFVIGFKGLQGYIKLEHPQLVIEFLVPEKGKRIDKPYPLPQLGLNAQTLRFLDFLTQNIIHTKVEDISITMPHPANFALHKLIILQRKRNPEKILKDKESAIKILKVLIEKGEQDFIRHIFNSMPQKWQKKVEKGIGKFAEKEILDIFINKDSNLTETSKS